MTTHEESAVNRVKTLFAESVQLQRSDNDRPFIIYTDGSYTWAVEENWIRKTVVGIIECSQQT